MKKLIALLKYLFHLILFYLLNGFGTLPLLFPLDIPFENGFPELFELVFLVFKNGFVEFVELYG